MIYGKTHAGIWDWVESDDAEHVEYISGNVYRENRHDVDVFRSRSTGRYIVREWRVGTPRCWWYIAHDYDSARNIAHVGYTSRRPRYALCLAPDTLGEVRALHALRRAVAEAAAEAAAEAVAEASERARTAAEAGGAS